MKQMMETPETAQPTADPHERANALVEQLETWLGEQRAADLITADEIETVVAELRADQAYWSALKPRFDGTWAKLEARLRKEDRPLKEILADRMVEKALEAAGDVEPDIDAVGAFLRSPAVEAMLGDLLYNGISEFMRRADFIGAVIDKLPVIGAIRKKILSTVADEIERRLEGQIKGFLGGFSGIAVERMILFIFRQENRAGFSSAQRQLMNHVLARPLNTLLPDAETMRSVRDWVWASLPEAALKNEREIIEFVFEVQGEEPLAGWLWPLSRTARGVGGRALAGFWDSERGEAFRP